MELSRIVVPIITPFDEKGRVYEKGVQNLLEFLSKKGIRAIWVLGSYGAFPLMSEEDRMQMADISIPIAHDLGITTIVQIGCPSTELAIKLARHAEETGAEGLATVVPFYYASAHYKETNFLFYFRSILDNTGLPLFYYNNPKTTGYTPSMDFLQKLLEAGVVGVKDTTSDFLSIGEKIRLFDRVKPNGVYLGGSSSVYQPAMAMGAKGVVCGTAVALPEIVLQLDKAIQGGDMAEARRIQKVIHRAREIQGRYVGRSVACYDILRARGIDAGTCKSPWRLMTKEQAGEVYSDLKDLHAID